MQLRRLPVPGSLTRRRNSDHVNVAQPPHSIKMMCGDEAGPDQAHTDSPLAFTHRYSLLQSCRIHLFEFQRAAAYANPASLILSGRAIVSYINEINIEK